MDPPRRDAGLVALGLPRVSGDGPDGGPAFPQYRTAAPRERGWTRAGVTGPRGKTGCPA